MWGRLTVGTLLRLNLTNPQQEIGQLPPPVHIERPDRHARHRERPRADKDDIKAFFDRLGR